MPQRANPERLMAFQVVSGGAIDNFVKANGLVLESDEFYVHADQVAVAFTDKGQVVYTKESGQARLLPFPVG